MKKALAFAAVLALLSGPALAVADAIPTGPTEAQLLTRVAALQAQASAVATGNPLACAALASVPAVAANQPFTLAWSSVGAIVPSASSTLSKWPLSGASSIVQQKPGTWTYRFDFHDASAGSVSCTASIRVLAA